jgi:hypothetical protein
MLSQLNSVTFFQHRLEDASELSCLPISFTKPVSITDYRSSESTGTDVTPDFWRNKQTGIATV